METLVQGIENNVATITEKVDELENRSRRNNIITHGFEEPKDESLEILFDTVTKNVLQGKLNVTICGVERCHRLGAKSINKIRPVILKLIDYREKVLILKNCSKLKGSDQYVTQDFSPKVRAIRKKL